MPECFPEHGRPKQAEPQERPRKGPRKGTRDLRKKKDAHGNILQLCTEYGVSLVVGGGECINWQQTIRILEGCLPRQRHEDLHKAKKVLSPKKLPYCIHRDIRVPVHKARVSDFAIGKYLGDFEYVQSRVGKVDPAHCLGIQNNYGVQVLAIERRYDGRMEWFPHVQTQFHPDDYVYFAAVHKEDDGPMPDFEGPMPDFKHTIVVDQIKVELFDTLELTGYDGDGRPLGVPEHLDNYIIGIARQRRAPGEQGALALRNTFGNLAIRLIRREGEEIRFPGPGDVLKYRDHIYMIYQKVSGDGKQVNPVLHSSVGLAESLMDAESFHAHVNRVNPTREPELRVIRAAKASESLRRAHAQRADAARGPELRAALAAGAPETPDTDDDF